MSAEMTEYVAVPLSEQPDEPKLIPITLFQVGKPKVNLEVSPSMSVANLKAEAYPDDVSSAKRIRFIHNGRVLNDDSTLVDCGLHRSKFIHVAISDPNPSTATARQVSDVIADDDEDQETADRRLAMMLAEREDGLVESDFVPMHAPEGDARDFMWGFILASLFGYMMIIFLVQPRVPRRQKLGILCGMFFFVMNGFSRSPEQSGHST